MVACLILLQNWVTFVHCCLHHQVEVIIVSQNRSQVWKFMIFTIPLIQELFWKFPHTHNIFYTGILQDFFDGAVSQYPFFHDHSLGDLSSLLIGLRTQGRVFMIFFWIGVNIVINIHKYIIGSSWNEKFDHLRIGGFNSSLERRNLTVLRIGRNIQFLKNILEYLDLPRVHCSMHDRNCVQNSRYWGICIFFSKVIDQLQISIADSI